MATLYLISTPIGNLEDITHRALRVLSEVEVLACEDTRTTRKILSHYEIRRPQTMFAYHAHNEEKAVKRILGALNDGMNVAVCSDGGMPGISDPGYSIVRAAIETGHEVDVLPGPSAVLTALVASGLPASSFVFKGFPPRKPGPRSRFFEADAESPHTLVLFESPFRLVATLQSALESLGDRGAAVCFELTKKFQRVERGTLSELISRVASDPPKGEITVVIAGVKDRRTSKG